MNKNIYTQVLALENAYFKTDKLMNARELVFTCE